MKRTRTQRMIAAFFSVAIVATMVAAPVAEAKFKRGGGGGSKPPKCYDMYGQQVPC